MKEFSLSFAARFDDYSDFGGTFNPQYGLVWRPIADLALRASYGTSFRPPSLFELYAPQIAVPDMFPDRQRHDEVARFVVLSGGNPNLDPTTADSLTAGIVITRSNMRGLRVAMNYWRVRMRGRVAAVPPYSVLADEGRYSDRVSREPATAEDAAAGQPGKLISVEVLRENLGASQTDGIDVEAACAFDTDIGQIIPRLSATWVHTFRSSDFPGSASRDRVGQANAFGTIPRLRAVASVGWNRNALGLSTSVRYVAAYQDTLLAVPTGRTIAAQALVDLQAWLELNPLIDRESHWRNLRLSFGVMNVLDTQPRFTESGYQYGYDPTQGDLKQRFSFIKLSKKF
jgi:iron complex outermembrane recepter protein